MNKPMWIALAALALVTLSVRMIDLDRAAVRSDEINFLNLSQPGQSVANLWKNPPWMNQIPLADSIPVIWHRVRPGTPDERTVREPFALIGTLTVLGSAAWLMRRRGVGAGVLVGLWMALLPFHVYQSREAYYYVVVMAFAAGMTLYTVDLFSGLRVRRAPSIKAVAWWTFWAVTTCLTHMSTWVIAAICWVLLVLEGWKTLEPADRRRHLQRMGIAAAVIGVFMVRWVLRALAEMQKVSQADGHLGGAFGWVGPRVIPFFTVGANPLGVAVSLAIALTALVAGLTFLRTARAQRDPYYGGLTLLVLAGFSAAYAYIGLVGGGAAKISYFTALLPLFLVWAVYTFSILLARLPARANLAATIVLALILVALLAKPAWMVTQLEGKPVPYKVLQAWLDQNLEPGSVVVVDRWYEPWNEMARYAPTNVVVTFTVPDEPYDTYRQLQWREVTRAAIEAGKGDAFIRLTRNHENRDGLWTWPETYFTRRGVVKNEAGLWQRERGYAANEDFYAANTNRLVAEIFYDLTEDRIARAARTGRPVLTLFGANLPYEKSGPMGIFRLQTQQFMDWRRMDQQGDLILVNTTDATIPVMVQVSAVAPRGAKLVEQAGSVNRFKFAPGQMQTWTFGPVEIAPGSSTLVLSDPLWTRDPQPLLIAAVELQPATPTP